MSLETVKHNVQLSSHIAKGATTATRPAAARIDGEHRPLRHRT